MDKCSKKDIKKIITHEFAHLLQSLLLYKSEQIQHSRGYIYPKTLIEKQADCFMAYECNGDYSNQLLNKFMRESVKKYNDYDLILNDFLLSIKQNDFSNAGKILAKNYDL